MNDALAQDAMKRSIQMDAVSDRELDLVQQLLGQASSASSGTAPILTVQADAWLVQANAYSQLAEADLLRVKAGPARYDERNLQAGRVHAVNHERRIHRNTRLQIVSITGGHS